MPNDQMPPHLPRTPTGSSRALNAILRRDLSSFTQKCFSSISPGQRYHHNWHIDAIAWHLEQCYRGTTKRLLITLPPRSLKSICASVAFPAWALGHDPGRRLICVSYGIELATKHARDFRTVMEADWYRALFPQTRALKDRELEYGTNRKGYRFSTSVGGTLTGRGGSLIIIDDPLKPEAATSKAARVQVKQWYDGTLYSRLDSKADDVIVLIMQRLHQDDLAGHVLGHEDWVHLNLPAIAEADQSIPVGPERWHHRETGDVLHPARESLSALNQVRAILIEDKGTGTSLIQELPREASIYPIAINPEGDKVTRMSSESAKIEAGQVFLPEAASWMTDFRTEILAFPMARHDDQVDSVSQILHWVDERRRGSGGQYQLKGYY